MNIRLERCDLGSRWWVPSTSSGAPTASVCSVEPRAPSLPLDERDDAWWLEERWRSPTGHVLKAFYGVKRAVPRRLQVKARRALARRQRSRTFPAWPFEDVLLRRRAVALEAALHARGTERLPVVAPWPDGHRFAYVFTHDVEGVAGLRRIHELLEVERRHGVVSSFNFCGAWYPVSDHDLQLVRDAGCEVGLHGMEHDHSLFASRRNFDHGLPRIRAQMEHWQAVGYRSPALHRWGPWMRELPATYDSSFPHSDPFQPQPGGCCAIHPFLFGDVVELPVTLDQDFTLFELLQQRDIRLWTDKSRWLIRHHGLVNVIVHPDYLTPERLGRYEELIAFLGDQPGGWHALPRDVAAWWRRRSRVRLDEVDGRPELPASAPSEAVVAWASLADGAIRYEPQDGS
jgi:hypothetical protein